MEVVTYIVDAPTLVNNINSIKQWAYDGSIRILIPRYVLEQVEEQYRASIAPKEPIKDQNPRKSWGKAPRKEHSLFDINPRIAWEYLNRATSENGEVGVIIQGEGEKFSHWEAQKEGAVRVESPPPPLPISSFAGALLRKVNIQEPSEANGLKGSTKPKLVARSSETKTPWTFHKIPTIPKENVSEALRPLFSCVLWRMYEHQDNSLEPERTALLTDDEKIRAAAATLKVQTRAVKDIRQQLTQFARSIEHRLEVGRLELDFPGRKIGKISRDEKIMNNGQSVWHEKEALDMNGSYAMEQKLPDPVPRLSPGHQIVLPYQPSSSSLTSTIPSALHHVHLDRASAQAPIGTGRPKEAPIGTGRPKVHKDLSSQMLVNRDAATTSSLLDTLMQGSNPDVPEDGRTSRPKSISPIGEITKPAEPESEIDSDEEVIVFNPRARRASGRPRTPAGPPKSRPTTSHAPSASFDSLKPVARSPIFSTLKPQSPVFTPGQTYVVPSNVPAQASPAPPTGPAEQRRPGISPPIAHSPARSPQPRPVTPRRPRGDIQNRTISHDHLQNQSAMIIRRQREAIERSVKAQAKPPPRQVQLEPTENPTVIDPDAFDRSYVVQQPSTSAPTVTPNGKPRAAGRGRRSPKGKESPRQAPRKPVDSPVVQDVDFVLKSGQPRGSTRSKGKLWVP